MDDSRHVGRVVSTWQSASHVVGCTMRGGGRFFSAQGSGRDDNEAGLV